MDKLKRQQSIRLVNTMLAAAGGGILSLTLLYAYYSKSLLVPELYLWIYLALFWLGSAAIIGTVAVGWNLRFRDPALSLPQMYWAVSASIGALLFSSRVDLAIYLLMLLTLVFGIFRISLRDFNIISVFVIVSIFCVHIVRLIALETDAQYSLALVQWMTFAFCAIALTHLCRSILTLRNRLREKNEQLLQALETKQQFLANMSHEIRTPMNGVLGMLDILLRDEVSAKQRRYLSVAHTSATSLLVVINDILDFSRMEAGKLHIEPIEFDMGDLAVEVMASFSANAEARGLELVLDWPADNTNWIIIADPVRIRQVLTNLLGNALKFTEQGEVVLAVKIDFIGDDWRLIVSIKDTGIGIESSKLSSLFESFTQSDASTTRIYGGTGLGLAICKHLCGLMQGNITASSELGRGSCFEFWVPIKRVNETETDFADFRAQMETKRILIVDQHPTSLKIFKNQLETIFALVTSAKSVGEALAILEMRTAEPFDLVILDLPLLGSEGLDLARAIRALPDKKILPILVLTSALGELNGDDLAAMGGVTNIHKPLLPARLFQSVAEALSASEAIRPTDPFLAVTEAGTIHLAPNEAIPIETQIEKGVTGTTKRRLKALLVEDNVTNQEVAAFLLDELGYEIDLAINGKEAVAAVENLMSCHTCYDVILMDCQMPVMDGYEATRHIRLLPKMSEYRVPIIAMTANVMPGDREKCLAAGMDDYVGKPILFDVVEKKLKYWVVDKHKQSPSSASLVIEAANSEDLVVASAEPICWDIDYLRKLVRNKEERMVPLLQRFVAELDATKDEIIFELNNRNLEKSSKLLHSLRGSAANLGARALPDLLQKMEAALRQVEISNAQKLAHEKLPTCISALKTEINQFLEQRSDHTDDNVAP